MRAPASTNIQNIGVNILNQSITQRFQEQVIRYGDRLAIKSADSTITYKELNGWANRIARAIIEKRGVGTEAIALLFKTGPEMIAAMLGVLKAGKFYVPLDVSWPGSRLKNILEDAGSELILSGGDQQKGSDFEQVVSGREVLWLDTLEMGISEENLEIESEPDDLAYILYTSGSSGRPKGVMQNHRYVLNLYRNYTNSGGMTEEDRFSLLYSGAFGGAVRDIYCALLNGAALLPLDVKEIGLHQLGRWLQDNEITVMFAVATLFRHFAATLKGQGHCPKLRLIQIGSETVYRQDAELFQENFSSQCTLMVNLGGTEISPVRQFPITKETVLTGATVPAGYGVEGTDVLLWDESGQEVPPGEVGEIVVRSRQVALGYWGQPELTKQVFVTDGDRRYFKTGDLGRLLPDGCLLHLGRKDFQVKIRGYRVETSEVEGALLSLESVREAVVVAQADVGPAGVGDRHLVAYLTAVNGENQPTAKELKEAMAEGLPDYAIPACFLWLESLPLTATGKIDRRALPKPESVLSTVEVVPPRNATEETLVKIWSEVLKLERIGIENNLFELGGNSLHGSQVLGRISEKFGIELPLKLIFEAPTISQLSNYIESVETSSYSPALAPTPTERGTEIPLSLAQQGLWFLAQLEENTAAYNLVRAFVVTGALDRKSLERAIAKVIDRHEILRTTFGTQNNSPIQVIAPQITVPLSVVDLLREEESAVKQVIVREQNRPFDLSQGPLVRFTLICVAEEKQILLLAMHHIISDDWSVQVLIGEISSLYKAFLTETPPSLRDLPIQYVDYAQWQSQRFAGDLKANQLQYWQQQLADVPPVLDLPLDRPRRNQPFKSGRVPFKINGEITEKLKALSKRSGTTLFITVMAAFSAFLSRYCDREDIVVGTPIANRTPAITEDLIGFFVNTLVLRTRPQKENSFQELLGQVRQVALEAYAHADVPFDALVELLKPERLPGVNPLFQVMFTLQNVPEEKLDLSGLTVMTKSLDKPTAGATFDLTLSLRESKTELLGAFEYNANLFDRATIERMAVNLQIFVEGITLKPEQKIAKLPLLSAAERQQLVVEWNQTQTDYPRNACVHQLFSEQVQNTPEAIAVVLNEQTLTYRELNQQANQLAHYLQSLGVGSESLVGVCLERSPNLIIALLAIVKAGGAYIPLDPTYPPERLAFMVENAGLKVIVTETGLGDHLPHVEYAVNLNTQGKTIADYPKDNLNTSATATSLAYVMYTSGSTGQPKGVSITHRNIVRLVKNTNYAKFTANDVVLQVASISFDAAPWEIWGSLLNGACLVLFPEQQLSLEVLGQVMRQHQVTVVLLTTGLFHLVVDEGLEDLRSLRLLVTGGDVLSVSHAHKCRQAWPHCQLINAYGPTENATLTSYYSVPTAAASLEQSMPIGRPVANTRVYILDSQHQPVPIGVVGELYTGGDGVARGYLNRPELNAERFISSPFNEGDILYKTGDKARYLPDGNIEFLGRIDSQVKIRGFRIELEEIQAVLSQHPQVRQGLVMVREDRPGDKSLVAYVKGSQQQALSSELRHYIQQKLPDYMVPNAIVWLDSFPLTPNGKVDRRALPIPDFERERSTDFVAPRTPVETVIANIIATVLGQERVGIHDNFFALGGHSLLATQVISRIRQSFGVSLPLVVMFEQPTLVDLAQAVEVAVKDNLVPLPTIEPIRRTEPLPLSFAQQRLWFLHRLEGSSSSYNIFGAWKLEGNLERVALEGSLQAIVQRHESLRTIFEVDGNDVPYQYITDTVTVTLPVMELTSAEQDTEVQQLIQAEAQQSFDLTKDRLIRFKLLQLSPTDHVLLVTMHHIVSDGWSMGVLVRELSQLYQAFCEGHASPLTPLTIQYGDFAYWQRQWFADQVLDTQLKYWQQQLAGIPPLLELPTDYSRPARQTFRGRRERFELDANLTQKLKALSQKAGVTLFMTLLAAFDVLLSRYSGQTDIVVGSPIANRNQAEIEPLIGFFVNTLVLRSDLSGNPSFLDLLTQVRKTTIKAYTHQDLPFEKLVEELQPERSLNHHPVFQVVLALQNAPRNDLAMSGLKAEALELDTGTIREFDLELHLFESDRGLSGLCVYSSDLFKTETIQRMLGHFQTLLQGIVADSSQAIGELPMLTPAEEQQILVEWNQTQTDYPRNACVHQLFEAQVQNTPDAIALVFAEQTLTYQELNQQANQLAHYLQSLGVGPESLVGVSLERSPNLIIALLAILKAGGAYLPLDPTYPPERLAFMVENAGLKVIVTETGLSENLPQVAHCVNLNTQGKTIAAHPKKNLNAQATATSLAYVMYTSGSTGQPKGVRVTHRNIVRLVKNTNYVKLGASDRIAQASNVAFDAATFEIWGALLNGGQLIGIPKDTLLSASDLHKHLGQHGITTLFITTALFNQLVNELPDIFAGLRTVLFGGEAVDPTPVRAALTADPPNRLIHVYGPTENTTFSLWYPVENLPLEATTIAIGRPIANTRAYILDYQQQPVPIGVAGELYAGGDGVARGYLNRPELNSERFIPSPFVEGDRLYKTGDKARYLADGNIEFLGRRDRQVKIRGFRIEPGEIEAVLSQHPGVKQAVVIVHENSLGDKSLVAYARGMGNGEYGELNQFLQQKLPDYLRPNTILWLDEFPLTANGKIDRRALPLPDVEAEGATEFVPPRTPTETVIAKIITEVLGRERVGIHENFFALGGHSLLAIKVISRLREKFAVDLPVRSLFESPTVANLAAIVANSQEATKADIIPTASEGQLLPLSFAQTRLWFLNRLEEAPNATYNVTVALEITGLLDVAALERGLQEIIRRHGILRTRIQIVNGIPQQAIAPVNKFQLNLQTLEDSLKNSPLQRRQFLQERATAEAETPFDLERDDPMRVSLWQWSPENYAFFLTLHHIVSDGWSMELLFQELSTLYAAFAKGEASPLRDLPIQYPDYAVWQRQWLTGSVLETELNYWKEQLAGISSPINLPTDRPRPPVQTFRGGRVPFKLDASLSQGLRTLAVAHTSTLFMTLLGAFAVLLWRYSSQDDIPIGIPVANRNHHQAESLIGFFVNTLVLRTSMEGNASFQDLLPRVRQVALDAYSHQDLPFEKVVEAVQPSRSPSYSPLFQVMFALEQAPNYGEFPGLTLTPIEWENQAAKFEISLSMVEDEEGLGGNWEYNQDLFDRETIVRMNRCWQIILEGIVANPEMPVEQLPLLPPEERHRLLVEWNQTERDYPERSVLELFADRVRQQPEAIALQHGDRLVTYQELDSQSDRLAGYLQSLGVKAETIVGICLDRSPEIILALWAILKAGGAYVPIDPASPRERITYILQDTKLSILLSRNHLAANFSHREVVVVDMDIDWQSFARTAFVPAELPPDRLAYVIYTSGSTGKPKGVEICHRALGNLVMGAIANYQLVRSDRWLQFFSFSFDAAVEDIYPCLLSGGTLVLRSDEMLASSEQFWQQCREWQITVLNIPTAYWHLLAANLTRETRLPASLRLVIIGGEQALPGSLAQWQDYMVKLSHPPQLINAYGPTEATVTTTLYPVTTVDGEALMLPTIPIGKPIGNAKVYVLDRLMQPVPVGVPGELYIGGAGLARGYLHRWELKAEKFVLNPFGEGRLYKTGDKVRYLPDGNLEFIGRFDNQVKLRGFRIELGEIEAILSQQESVREAVAILHEDSPGNKRLIAYVVLRETAEIQDAIAHLKANLREMLPEYMVPEAIVPLSALPLTVTGKVDRRALPAPPESKRAPIQDKLPQTNLEQQIARIWESILTIDGISREENFFDLGGTSLLMIQACERLNNHFQIKLSIVEMFLYPTIRDLADRIHQQLHSQEPAEEVIVGRSRERYSSGSKQRQKRREHRQKRNL